MKALLISVALAFAAVATSPVPSAAQAPGAAAPAPLSVEKTPIGVLWANPAAKAVLLKELPSIGDYLDQIKDMTLAQVAPLSDGRIDDGKLKAIQAQLDKIK